MRVRLAASVRIARVGGLEADGAQVRGDRQRSMEGPGRAVRAALGATPDVTAPASRMAKMHRQDLAGEKRTLMAHQRPQHTPPGRPSGIFNRPRANPALPSLASLPGPGP